MFNFGEFQKEYIKYIKNLTELNMEFMKKASDYLKDLNNWNTK